MGKQPKGLFTSTIWDLLVQETKPLCVTVDLKIWDAIICSSEYASFEQLSWQTKWAFVSRRETNGFYKVENGYHRFDEYAEKTLVNLLTIILLL
jgi:hypothetical protein